MPRNSTGNYSLPLPPVAAGEIIEADWANATLDDIGQALTDSLDRYGRGGMLAPFLFFDGSVSAPGAAWANAPGTGFFRTPSALGASWNGEEIFNFNSNGITLTAGNELFIPQAPATNNSAINKQYLFDVLGDPATGYLPIAGGTMKGTLNLDSPALLSWLKLDNSGPAWWMGINDPEQELIIFNGTLGARALTFDPANSDAHFAGALYTAKPLYFNAVSVANGTSVLQVLNGDGKNIWLASDTRAAGQGGIVAGDDILGLWAGAQQVAVLYGSSLTAAFTNNVQAVGFIASGTVRLGVNAVLETLTVDGATAAWRMGGGAYSADADFGLYNLALSNWCFLADLATNDFIVTADLYVSTDAKGVRYAAGSRSYDVGGSVHVLNGGPTITSYDWYFNSTKAGGIGSTGDLRAKRFVATATP